MRSLFVLTVAALWAGSLSVHSQVIFNDNFNGSNVSTNNGTGAVNPTASTAAFTGSAGQSPNGAYYNPDPAGFYSSQTEVSATGNASGNSAFGLTPTGVNFQVTAADVSVSRNGGARGDIPGSSDAGFRFELGIVSANAGTGDPEVYNNGNGGVYVNLFYDAQGNLTGDLRVTSQTKPGGDSAGPTSGIDDVANFTLASGTAPVTVDFDLTSTGYSISFSQAVTSLNGSLSGNFADAGITTGFDNGVRASLFGQEWSGGSGTGNITNFDVSVAPEPPAVYLLGLGVLALGFLSLRRTARAS